MSEFGYHGTTAWNRASHYGKATPEELARQNLPMKRPTKAQKRAYERAVEARDGKPFDVIAAILGPPRSRK